MFFEAQSKDVIASLHCFCRENERCVMMLAASSTRVKFIDTNKAFALESIKSVYIALAKVPDFPKFRKVACRHSNNMIVLNCWDKTFMLIFYF